MGKRKGKRRWFQFSLRLMFIVITLCAVLLGLRMWHVRQRQQAVDAVRKLGGSVLLGPDAPVPEWLQPLVFPRVIIVDLDGTQATNADLARLSGLKGLQTLKLGNTKVTSGGLEPLAGLVELRKLWLGGTGITDADLIHLAALRNLATLDLGGTQVSDAGLKHLERLGRLEELSLFDTQVTDAGLQHLAGLSRLKRLSLEERHITAAGIKHLKRLTSLQTILVHVPSGLGKRARDLLGSLPKVHAAGVSQPDGPAIWEAATPWEITPAGVAEAIHSIVKLKPDELAAIQEVLAQTRRPHGWHERRGVAAAPGPAVEQKQKPISVEEFLEALKKSDDETFWREVYRRSETAREAIPRLLELLKDKDFDVRRRALAVLGRVGGTDKQVAAAVAGVLKDENPSLRSVAACALEVMGPQMDRETAKMVVPLLVGALEDKPLEEGYWAAGSNAVDALRSIGQSNPEETRAAIPALLGLLRDVQRFWLFGVPYALECILQRNPEEVETALSVLLRMLENVDQDARGYVVDAVGRVAQHDPRQAKRAVPVLLKTLRDQSSMAADALGRIVERDRQQLKTIIPQLLRMLQDEDDSVRQAAERALTRIARAICTSSARGSGGA